MPALSVGTPNFNELIKTSGHQKRVIIRVNHANHASDTGVMSMERFYA
jgi:hypothetical protein